VARLLIHGLGADSIAQLRTRHTVCWVADDSQADIVYSQIRDLCSIPPLGTDQMELQPVLRHVATKAHQIFESYSRHHYLRRINGRPVQDYSYLMTAHAEWAYGLLCREQPDVVLFANIPHEGYDNVLLEVANFLGIRTVMFFQVPFSPRHWILDGSKPVAESLAPARATYEGALDDEYLHTFIRQLDGQGTYFYMKHIRPVAIPTAGEIAGAFLSGRLKQALAGTLAAAQQAGYDRRLKRLVQSSPKCGADQAYGYFPLHLQPELTTSALGEGLYFNQVAAFRHFAAVCADAGMPVIVKDNPKQNYSHRSQYFFDAMGSVSNAIYVSREASSQQLVQHASVLGTVSGTAGLEALRHGKPVVCYGDAWWRGLAGVHRPSARAADVVGSVVDRDGVSRGLAQLYGLSQPGCSDPDYVAAFQQIPARNAQRMADSVDSWLSTAGLYA